nr:TetR/AcrR family transcriptional regulator [Methylomonas lenta]
MGAAEQAFIVHGYSGASMAAIAEVVPVSKPSLYNHFKGKQELFVAVIASQCVALLNMLKGDRHFRCLLGLQSGLSGEEKRHLIDAAVSLFLKGHGHDV